MPSYSSIEITNNLSIKQFLLSPFRKTIGSHITYFTTNNNELSPRLFLSETNIMVHCLFGSRPNSRCPFTGSCHGPIWQKSIVVIFRRDDVSQ